MKTLLTAVAVLSLSAGSAALAQSYGGRNDDHRGPPPQAQDHRDDRGGPGRADDRGPAAHHWARGQRLPKQYWNGGYTVSDWKTRPDLRAPPRGYHWVQVDNNYILAGVATGVIASIIANNH